MIFDAANSCQAWPCIRLITFMRPISSDAAALTDAPKRTLSTLSDESGAHHTLTRNSLPVTACEIHGGYWCLLDSNNKNVLWEASAETAFLAEWCARCWAPLDNQSLFSRDLFLAIASSQCLTKPVNWLDECFFQWQYLNFPHIDSGRETRWMKLFWYLVWWVDMR